MTSLSSWLQPARLALGAGASVGRSPTRGGPSCMLLDHLQLCALLALHAGGPVRFHQLLRVVPGPWLLWPKPSLGRAIPVPLLMLVEADVFRIH